MQLRRSHKRTLGRFDEQRPRPKKWSQPKSTRTGLHCSQADSWHFGASEWSARGVATPSERHAPIAKPTVYGPDLDTWDDMAVQEEW
jgi:hypothetical protein